MQKRTSILAWALGLFAVAALPFADAGAQGKPKRIDVLIGFTRTPGNTEEALVRGFGGEIRFTVDLIPCIVASVPEGALRGLRHHPLVTVVDPDTEIQAVGEFDAAWGVTHINADDEQAGGNTGAGIRVAVLDTGVDHAHSELAGAWRGGWDFVNNDDDPMDDGGHGTHVAGTICAAINGQSVGGVAPGVELYALKVLGHDGSGSFGAVIAALDWCVKHGIQVTNNSYGSSVDPGSQVQAAFDAARDAGVVCCVSAGNSGHSNGKGRNVGYPARYASTIAVAATGRDLNNDGDLDDAGEKDERAYYSSTGPEVTIAAPGTWIGSTFPGGSGIITASGTSMACPHATGTAALILGAGLTDANGNGRVNDEVEAALINTAHDLGDSGHDNQYGYGLIDADAAPSSGTATPAVTITAPVTDFSYAGGAITLTADTAATWVSSIDGALGSGASIQANLSAGIHIITALVSAGGHTGGDSIRVFAGLSGSPATAPAITAPSVGASLTQYAQVILTASATDASGSDISASISWSSSEEGNPIGTGASVAWTPSTTGIHVLAANVTAGGVTRSTSLWVNVTAAPVNNAPVVSISSPANGATFSSGATITLAGSATDSEDGDVTASLVWKDQAGNTIATGAGGSWAPADGSYTITATATDSQSATGSAAVSITVGTPPPPPPSGLNVVVVVRGGSGPYHKGDKVYLDATVTDAGGNPVNNATVTFTINTPNGGTFSGTDSSGANGVYTVYHRVNVNRDGDGTYSVSITATRGSDSASDTTSFTAN